MPGEEIRTEVETKTVNNAHYAEVMPFWVNVERIKCDFHLSLLFYFLQNIDI